MRSGESTGQCEKQLFRAGEIPTWQWLWSVFPALTWDGFSSHATRLNRGTPFISRNPPGIDATLTPHVRGRPVAKKKQVRKDSLGDPLRLQLDRVARADRLSRQRVCRGEELRAAPFVSE